MDSADLPRALRSLGSRYREALTGQGTSPETVRTRPAPEVWSQLEYLGHVRDVLLAQRERILLALVEDRPNFAPMYRDRRVDLARYNREAYTAVVDEIEMAADLIAWLLEGLSSEQLSRPCIYNYPVPTERSLAWVADHTLHEGEHHLRDIEAR